MLEIGSELESLALADDYFIERRLCPNLDFYTVVIHTAIGFPLRMFAALFRPRRVFIGKPERSHVPIRVRGGACPAP